MRKSTIFRLSLISFLVFVMVIGIIPFSLSQPDTFESYQFNFYQEGTGEDQFTSESDMNYMNMRNRTYFNGEYRGSYTFGNIPNNFWDTSNYTNLLNYDFIDSIDIDGDGIFNKCDLIGNRKNVFGVKGSDGGTNRIYHTINESEGIYEIAIYKPEDSYCLVYFKNDETTIQYPISIFISDNENIRVYNGSNFITVGTLSVDVWEFLKIEFDCSTDTFMLYQNEELLDTYNFRHTSDLIESIQFGDPRDTSEYLFFDSPSLVNENSYLENDLYFEYEFINGTSYDVDKYQFQHNVRFASYPLLEDVGFGWDETEPDPVRTEVHRATSDIYPEIQNFSLDSIYYEENTRSVRLYHTNEVPNTDVPYINNSFAFDTSSDFPVKVSWEMIQSEVNGGYCRFEIQNSYDETLSVDDVGHFGYFILETPNVYFYNQDTDTYETFDVSVSNEERVGIEATFNGNNQVKITVNTDTDNDTLVSYTTFNSSSSVSNLHLFASVFDSYTGSAQEGFFDNIGIVFNGISQLKDDFGLIYSGIKESQYTEGDYEFARVNGIEGKVCLTYENFDTERIQLYPDESFNSYTGNFKTFDNEVYNFWELDVLSVDGTTLDNPRFMFWVNSTGYVNYEPDFEVDLNGAISIYEVDNPSVKYKLEPDFDSFLHSDSYFYVENNSLFAYSKGTKGYSTYMYGKFDLTNLTQYYFINYSVKYGNYKTNWNWNSRFRVGFADGNYLGYSFPYDEFRIENTYSRQIPNYKYLDYFDLNITYSGAGDTTYQTNIVKISPIEFIYIPSTIPEITSWTFMEMIIALIVLFAPSISLRELVDKVMFIPTFTLMSVLCYATDIIPMWLFIITLVGIGLYSISHKENEVMFDF